MKLILIVVVTVLANSRCGFAQEEFQKSAQNLQNDFRAKYGAPPLALDNDLTAAAKKCAEYYISIGKADHNCPYKNGAGENLIVGDTDWNYNDLTPAGIQLFINEKNNYDYNAPAITDSTGHFTQLVWKSSSKFGIGFASPPGGAKGPIYGVVLYSPAGNLPSALTDNVSRPV